MVINKEKLIPNKDKIIQKIENIIFGKTVYGLFVELPSHIKLNNKK